MLKIHRVPTVVSLQQLDNSPEKSSEAVKPGLLDKESLTRAKLPLLRCAVTSRAPCTIRRIRSFGDISSPEAHVVPDVDDFSSSSSESSGMLEDFDKKSTFDNVCLSEWEDRAEQGLFRYDVTACSTKIISGKYGFVAQLNEGRATKKRPTEFRVDQVLQSFDEKKFNFTKASQEEVLFQFDIESGAEKTSYADQCDVPEGAHLLLINVSPIEYGHVLLVPRLADSLPQMIEPSVLYPALELCAQSNNPYFRTGYNSLGAYATINHLHFQGYYLMAPFPVELCPTTPLVIKGKRKRGDSTVHVLQDYPVRGLVFEVGASLRDLAHKVGEACKILQENNVPFNLLIVDSGNRVFLFPQCYAEKQARNEVPEHILATGVNPAAFEICGHLVLKAADDYEHMTEDKAVELLAQVSLSAERFEEVCDMCLDGVAM